MLLARLARCSRQAGARAASRCPERTHLCASVRTILLPERRRSSGTADENRRAPEGRGGRSAAASVCRGVDTRRTPHRPGGTSLPAQRGNPAPAPYALDCFATLAMTVGEALSRCRAVDRDLWLTEGRGTQRTSYRKLTTGRCLGRTRRRWFAQRRRGAEVLLARLAHCSPQAGEGGTALPRADTSLRLCASARTILLPERRRSSGTADEYRRAPEGRGRAFRRRVGLSRCRHAPHATSSRRHVIASSSAGPGRPGLLRYARNDDGRMGETFSRCRAVDMNHWLTEGRGTQRTSCGKLIDRSMPGKNPKKMARAEARRRGDVALVGPMPVPHAFARIDARCREGTPPCASAPPREPILLPGTRGASTSRRVGTATARRVVMSTSRHSDVNSVWCKA